MKSTSLPFVVARQAVSATAWIAGKPQAPDKPLTEQLDDWDSAAKLPVHTELRIEPSRLRAETGLEWGSRLRLCSGWHCEATRTREVLHTHDVVLDESAAQELVVTPSFSLLGPSLARSVRLESRLVLVEAGPGSSRIAAKIPGSILWAFEQELVLEGQKSRFPMEWADFRSSVYSDDAAWALDWDPQELECSTLGGVKLLLNQSHRVTAPLLRESPPSDAAKLLWDTIHFDIARQLVEGALTNDDFVENSGHYGEGTLGATVRRMIEVHFPYHNITTLRALVVRSRTQFETLLQASLRMYGSK
ncbi:hypothetical protein ENSA5_44890 [Enhygromyxa salina]|uniref:Uncharacterized protein n=1 Tax=Enhygromyxa salina TaxID=215803 RepID=A0A2S9XK93_9BACT|nr:hypothetical protein [Enhygromyxa salina]PRP93150.1 hypothetical protein ENSA5_44890 [Enhygromyxa salina]